MNKPEFIITSETGRMILEWCNSGSKSNLLENFTPSSSAGNNMPKIDPKEAFEGISPYESNPGLDLTHITEKEVFEAIQNCKSVTELLALYRQFPQFQESLQPDFEAKKSLLINLNNPNNFSKNGHSKFQ